MVLSPLAAAPGLTLPEIHATVEAADESLSPIPPMIFLVSGLAIGAAIATCVYVARTPTSPASVGMAYLVVLVLGTPAYFVASFSAGMSLADTFAISGGDHSP